MSTTISTNIAKQFRDSYFGGNWTFVNLQDQLADLTWQEATTKISGLNSIAALVFHIGYYNRILIPVLEGGALVGKDSESWETPVIENEEAWRSLVEGVFADVDKMAILLEQYPDEKLWDVFHDGNYGNNYRNFTGIIEHLNYHLGQISFIKKLIRKG